MKVSTERTTTPCCLLSPVTSFTTQACDRRLSVSSWRITGLRKSTTGLMKTMTPRHDLQSVHSSLYYVVSTAFRRCLNCLPLPLAFHIARKVPSVIRLGWQNDRPSFLPHSGRNVPSLVHLFSLFSLNHAHHEHRHFRFLTRSSGAFIGLLVEKSSHNHPWHLSNLLVSSRFISSTGKD